MAGLGQDKQQELAGKAHDLRHSGSRQAAQVRFFERVKLERRIRRLQAAVQAARRAGGEPAPADAAALAQAQDDLQARSAVPCCLRRAARKARGRAVATAPVTPCFSVNP